MWGRGEPKYAVLQFFNVKMGEGTSRKRSIRCPRGLVQLFGRYYKLVQLFCRY